MSEALNGTVDIATLEAELVSLGQFGMSKVPVDGSQEVFFHLTPGWEAGLADLDDLGLINAEVSIAGMEYQLTKGALLKFCSNFGLPTAYVLKCPAILTQTNLNYWAKNSDKPVKALFRGSELLMLAKSEHVVPYDNNDLLQMVLDHTETHYNFVAPRRQVGIDLTTYRLLAMDDMFEIEEDWWIPGVQISNSLTGNHVSSLREFIYNEHTGESILTENGSAYSRKTMGQDTENFHEWAVSVEKEIRNSTQASTQMQEAVVDDLHGHPGKALAAAFHDFRAPMKARAAILQHFADRGDMTRLGMIRSVASAATVLELTDKVTNTCMEIAGVLLSHDKRCPSCAQTI